MSNDYNGKKRSELPDSVFGIPQERKYPMPDEKHTRSAIKLFNHVEPKYEEQLAKAIIKNMKKYNIDGSVVGPNNRLRKYLPKDMIKECIEYVMMDYNVMRGAPFIPKRNSRIYGAYLTEDKTMCYMATDKSTISESVLCIPILENCSKKNIQIMKDIIKDSESEEFKGFRFTNISYYKIEYDNDKPIGFGTVRTKLIDDHTIGYVSVLVLPEYRGKGYGTKITEYIIDWFKGERGIDFLEWWYKPDNDASKALANKAGFIEYIATDEDQWKRTYMKNESSLLSESDNSKRNPYQYTVIKFLNREIKPFVLGNKEWRKRAKDIHLTLTFKIHDTVSRYIGVTILDGSQEYRDTDQARHLLKEIKLAIMNYSKHNQEMKLVKRVNLGDGDEGSIYFDLGFINMIIHRSLDAKVVGEQVEDIPTVNSSIYLEKAYKDIMGDKYINPIDTGIHTIIFDIGDVLVSSNIEDYLERDPEVPNSIIDELVKLWFVDKDEIDDTLNLEEYKEISIKRMGPEFSKYIPKLFKYNVECVNAFDYTIPMIQDLKSKGYAVYYLSNWSAWTHELLKEAGKFDFLNLMDGGVFSYDAGYRKPDLEIYNILLNKYKIDPKTAIFFDDKKDNIVAANKLGINGYLFDQHDSDLVYYALRDMYARKVTESTIDSNIYLEESTVSEYGTTGGTIVGSNQPLYFYHMVDSGANLSKGLLSLGYMYHHSKPLFLKNASKYRDRLCNGWDIYPGRDPKSLTAEEIYEGIKKFRNEDNLNTIYFFRYPPYSSLDKRFDRLYKYKKLYRININDPKVKSIIKNINYGWIDSNTGNDPLDRKYYETISPEDYFNNFDPDKGLLFSTLHHISIEVKNGYIPMRLLEEVKVPNTIEDIISMEESSIQEYGTTGGTIVGSNQPDSVYIVNYMQNNAFSGHKEPKFGICRKGMKDLHIVGGKYNRFHYVSDLDKFKEEASDIHVYRFKGKPKNEFFDIIEEMKDDNDLDLYKLITGREIKDRSEIRFDGDFIEEECFFDTIDAIKACTEAGLLEASTDLHPVPILTETVQGRPYNYYRDLNGVFIQHEITGLRSKSYDTLDDIPDAETEIVKRGYLV